MSTDDTTRKGAKTKLLGVGLIIVAALDCMLSWRGGLVVSDFYLLLFAAGSILIAIGTIRGSKTQQNLHG